MTKFVTNASARRAKSFAEQRIIRLHDQLANLELARISQADDAEVQAEIDRMIANVLDKIEQACAIRDLELPGGCGAARYTVIFNSPATGSEEDSTYETFEAARAAADALPGKPVFWKDQQVGVVESAWVEAIEELERPGGCGAMRFPKFFSIDDGKAVKAQTAAKGWLNAINYMSPADTAGVGNLCPFASAGCKALCLGTESGQAAMRKEGQDNSVTLSRKAKARFFMRERAAFMRELHLHISKACARARMERRRLCVRLNGSTDIAWESAKLDGVGIMDHFPDVQFVDYTKSFARMMRFCAGGMPANYHLTFSRSEDNEEQCRAVLAEGGNVAVVFGGGELPTDYLGALVLDGDRHDLRHLDSRPGCEGGHGAVVGLKPKGNKAKRDASGFVVRSW